MHDVPNLTDFSISTSSTNPLRGVIRLGISGSRLTVRIAEETAHQACSELERFLTQACPREAGSKAPR